MGLRKPPVFGNLYYPKHAEGGALRLFWAASFDRELRLGLGAFS